VHVVTVDSLAALDAHAASWDALAQRAPRALPIASHAWVASVLETFPPPRGWRCHLAYEGERLLGVLPVVRRWHPLVGPLGIRLRVPAHFATPDGDALIAPEAPDVLGVLVDEAQRHEPRWFSLERGAVDPAGPTGRALERRIVLRAHEIDGSSFAVAGDADAWRSGLSKNLRSDLKRAENRAKADGHPPTARFESNADERSFEEFLRIEASGWKGEEGTAVGASTEQTALYRRATRRMASRGWLEWQFLDLGDRAAAVHLCCRMGRSLFILKLGYDDDMRAYSPGALLLLRAIEREHRTAASDVVDFTTDYPWLRRWRTTVTPYERVRLYPRRALPFVLGVLPARARARVRNAPLLRPLVRRLRGESAS
jgi:CelD/BcsL family acetyltransferase involved in cellulose biosynthesis